MANINKNEALSLLDEALDHLNSFPIAELIQYLQQRKSILLKYFYIV